MPSEVGLTRTWIASIGGRRHVNPQSSLHGSKEYLEKRIFFYCKSVKASKLS